MFHTHTHTPRCREADFLQLRRLCWSSYSDPETGVAIIASQNSGKNCATELSELLKAPVSTRILGRVTDIGERLHLCRLPRQLVSGLGQVAGKVGQVCCREDLNRIRMRGLQLLQYANMARLAALSLLRMFQRTVASWWIWIGAAACPAWTTTDSVSSISDPDCEAWFSPAWFPLSDSCG